MASVDFSHQSLWAQIRHALAVPFIAIGNFMVQAMNANGRLDQIERLQAMSDEDLAKIGIRRTEIVTYVFRDRFSV